MTHSPAPVHQMCDVITVPIDLEGKVAFIDLFLKERGDIGDHGSLGKNGVDDIAEFGQKVENMFRVSEQG